MSARSTPAPNPPSRSNSNSLLSPASYSFEQPPTPTGSYPFSRRRQPSSNSFGLASVPESFRFSPAFGSRKASQTSASGTSTPYGQPKRRKPARQTAGDNDWAGMEPDEVFRRLPVGEVKKVEAKMRSDALNKQSELRSMVGTRYRDLLTSATQITALRSSSLKLSKSLRDVRDTCLGSDSSDVNVTMETEEAPSEGDDVMSMLPVAAHVKLLLDAPEALYSYLARHAFLRAAFLWLITRVVKEGLSAMPEDVKGPYLPLMQKQWETLQPFRGQIVQRATASLRSREKADPKILSESLLAIILLDNLPVPEALSLYLNQRTKTLRDILAHPEPSSSKHTLSPTIGRARGDSRASLKSINKERDEIGNILSESVTSLLETVNLAGVVFQKNAKVGSNESMLEEMQRLIQVGQTLPTTSKSTPLRRTSHERRASRLASISLPMPKFPTSPSDPPISASQVLADLPSSQILLRHLPPSITGFTPFIAPSSTPDLDEKIQSWQKSSLSILREALPAWLGALHSVADIWRVRSDLIKLLSDGSLAVKIQDALETEWGERIKSVWETKLSGLLRVMEEKVREAGEEIRQHGDEHDINPESFLFSDLPFPAPPASALTASSAPFTAFIAAVGKRSSLRTPSLDSVLTTLEDYAKDLQGEIIGLPRSLYAEFGKIVESTLVSLVKVLEKVLESMGPARGDGKDGIAAELFVGRVAIYLARQSDFVQTLTKESDVELATTFEGLVKVHEASVTRWRLTAVEEALGELEPIFHPLVGPQEVKASWQGPYPTSPSAPIMIALHSLTSSTRNLGLSPESQLPVVRKLVIIFVEKAMALPGWDKKADEEIAQTAFDLSLLDLLLGEGDIGQAMRVQRLLNKLPSSIPSEFKDTLPRLVLDHLRRSQLLIHPLLQHLDSSKLAPNISISESKNGLLRFGAVKSASGLGSDFKSPLAVAKPGKRFGLLSITA